MASVTGALLAAGTLTSFVLAVRVSERSTRGFEALGPALAAIEGQRNRINCLDPGPPPLFGANCTPNAIGPVAAANGVNYTITPVPAGNPDYFLVTANATYTVP